MPQSKALLISIVSIVALSAIFAVGYAAGIPQGDCTTDPSICIGGYCDPMNGQCLESNCVTDPSICTQSETCDTITRTCVPAGGDGGGGGGGAPEPPSEPGPEVGGCGDPPGGPHDYVEWARYWAEPNPDIPYSQPEVQACARSDALIQCPEEPPPYGVGWGEVCHIQGAEPLACEEGTECKIRNGHCGCFSTGVCPNGICDMDVGETRCNCPQDCGPCIPKGDPCSAYEGDCETGFCSYSGGCVPYWFGLHCCFEECPTATSCLSHPCYCDSEPAGMGAVRQSPQYVKRIMLNEYLKHLQTEEQRLYFWAYAQHCMGEMICINDPTPMSYDVADRTGGTAVWTEEEHYCPPEHQIPTGPSTYQCDIDEIIEYSCHSRTEYVPIWDYAIAQCLSGYKIQEGAPPPSCEVKTVSTGVERSEGSGNILASTHSEAEAWNECRDRLLPTTEQVVDCSGVDLSQICVETGGCNGIQDEDEVAPDVIECSGCSEGSTCWALAPAPEGPTFAATAMAGAKKLCSKCENKVPNAVQQVSGVFGSNPLKIYGNFDNTFITKDKSVYADYLGEKGKKIADINDEHGLVFKDIETPVEELRCRIGLKEGTPTSNCKSFSLPLPITKPGDAAMKITDPTLIEAGITDVFDLPLKMDAKLTVLDNGRVILTHHPNKGKQSGPGHAADQSKTENIPSLICPPPKQASPYVIMDSLNIHIEKWPTDMKPPKFLTDKFGIWKGMFYLSKGTVTIDIPNTITVKFEPGGDGCGIPTFKALLTVDGNGEAAAYYRGLLYYVSELYGFDKIMGLDWPTIQQMFPRVPAFEYDKPGKWWDKPEDWYMIKHINIRYEIEAKPFGSNVLQINANKLACDYVLDAEKSRALPKYLKGSCMDLINNVPRTLPRSEVVDGFRTAFGDAISPSGVAKDDTKVIDRRGDIATLITVKTTPNLAETARRGAFLNNAQDCCPSTVKQTGEITEYEGHYGTFYMARNPSGFNMDGIAYRVATQNLSNATFAITFKDVADPRNTDIFRFNDDELLSLANVTEIGTMEGYDAGGNLSLEYGDFNITISQNSSVGANITKYIVTKRPSCFDEIQNGDETGVDCGGSCIRPEINRSQEPCGIDLDRDCTINPCVDYCSQDADCSDFCATQTPGFCNFATMTCDCTSRCGDGCIKSPLGDFIEKVRLWASTPTLPFFWVVWDNFKSFLG